MYDPQFRITPAIAKALMTIEACRQAIDDLPVTVTLLTALREIARLQATHYSTQIEGNRLTLAQMQNAISGGGQFQGQERDVREVRHYFQALDEVDTWSREQTPITEEQIQILHGLAMEGRHHPTPYRQGQNVIRDSRTGDIVYMPKTKPSSCPCMRKLAFRNCGSSISFSAALRSTPNPKRVITSAACSTISPRHLRRVRFPTSSTSGCPRTSIRF